MSVAAPTLCKSGMRKTGYYKRGGKVKKTDSGFGILCLKSLFTYLFVKAFDNLHMI